MYIDVKTNKEEYVKTIIYLYIYIYMVKKIKKIKNNNFVANDVMQQKLNNNKCYVSDSSNIWMLPTTSECDATLESPKKTHH